MVIALSLSDISFFHLVFHFNHGRIQNGVVSLGILNDFTSCTTKIVCMRFFFFFSIFYLCNIHAFPLHSHFVPNRRK